MNVSKELLNEVLNIEREIKHIDFIEKWNTFIYYVDGGAERTINIYELQHKCKEWARIKSYLLYSYPVDVLTDRYACDVKDKRRTQIMMQPADTEPEAVIKATQWVLDNKDKQ